MTDPTNGLTPEMLKRTKTLAEFYSGGHGRDLCALLSELDRLKGVEARVDLVEADLELAKCLLESAEMYIHGERSLRDQIVVFLDGWDPTGASPAPQDPETKDSWVDMQYVRGKGLQYFDPETREEALARQMAMGGSVTYAESLDAIRALGGIDKVTQMMGDMRTPTDLQEGEQ